MVFPNFSAVALRDPKVDKRAAAETSFHVRRMIAAAQGRTVSEGVRNAADHPVQMLRAQERNLGGTSLRTFDGGAGLADAAALRALANADDGQ